MLKKYQVAEWDNGMWSVYEVYDQWVCSVDSNAVEMLSTGCGFETAAEAQELADQLNEKEQGE